MPAYKAPVEDALFLLNDVFHIERYANLPGFSEATPDVVAAVLGTAGRFCEEVLAPLNRIGDEEGCRRGDDGRVATPTGFKEAYRRYVEGGWIGVAVPPAYGGLGLPVAISQLISEFMVSANLAFAMYPTLTQGRDRGAAGPRLGGAEGALRSKTGDRRMDRHHESYRGPLRDRSWADPHQGGS